MRLGELINLYQQVRKDKDGYWDDLQKQFDGLLRTLVSELGLDDKIHPQFHVGILNSNGEFERQSSSSLPRNDGWIDFAIRLVLDIKESVEPPNLVVTKWSIRGARDGFYLKGQDGKGFTYEDPRRAAQCILKRFEDDLREYSPY